MNMPPLIAVLPRLVTFAFHKAKNNTISIQVNVQNACIHTILGSRHQIPLQSHKCTSKYTLFPFLLQKLLADLLVDFKAYLLLPNHRHIPFQDLLFGNVLSDALRELVEVIEEIRLHGILAHAEKMLESTLRLPRLPIPVFRNLFFEHKKTFLPGFLRFFFLCFPGEFFTGTWFWRGHRNSGFWTPSQEFFAGIPVGQEFLYFLRIPLDSVPTKSCLAQAS
jgi:hypothetical protein